MKITPTKINNVKYKLDICADPELVKNKFEEVFSEISKNAKIKGFRQGCAPRQLVEKYYQDEANKRVLNSLIPLLIEEAEKKLGLEIVDTNQIQDVELKREYLSFKAFVEVKPEIKLKEYKRIRVNCHKVEVKTEEVEKALQRIKEINGLETLDDNSAHILGCFNLEELKEVVEKEIFLEKINLRFNEIKKQVIEYLIKELNIELPSSLVNKQKEILLQNTKEDWILKGGSEEEFLKHEEKLKTQLENLAKEQIKVSWVLSEIAKKENIPLDDKMGDNVLKFLLKTAEWVTD